MFGRISILEASENKWACGNDVSMGHRRNAWVRGPVTDRASPTKEPGDLVSLHPKGRLMDTERERNFYFECGSFLGGGGGELWACFSWVTLYTNVNSFNILQPKAELYSADTRGCGLEVSDSPYFLELVECHTQLCAFLL